MDIYIANHEVRCSSGTVKKGAQMPELDSKEIRYLKKARGMVVYAVFLAAGLALSLLVVYPLWFFATERPDAYSLFCLILLLLGIALLIITKIIRSRNNKQLPENSSLIKRRRKTFWLTLCKIILTLVCFYILFLQFSTGSVVLGVLLAVIFFFLLGWVFFGGRDEKKLT